MFAWRKYSIPRLHGLDLKTNVIDVKDGESLACENVYGNSIGVISKRAGNEIMFTQDEAGSIRSDEGGSAILGSTKYYFTFSNGKFSYATTKTGAKTTISPSPAISTTNDIWWDVLDNKLFFVDGTNVLRYFDGTSIKVSSILIRPTVAPTTATVGAGFDYTYTVDNQLGESPAAGVGAILLNAAASAAVVVTGACATGQTLAVGDRIRIYARANNTLTQFRNVTVTGSGDANVTFGTDSVGPYYQVNTVAANYTTATGAIAEDQKILYTDLGVAINASAPSALAGIVVHYGRIVGWYGSNVQCSKVTNAHSWPPDSAVKEAFTYGFFRNDGETITACKPYHESLYVFKDTKIACFGGIGPDDTGNNAFTFRRLETNGIGAVAGKSLQVVGDDAENTYLVWLARDGFYATTGDKPVRVGEKIEIEVQAFSLSNQRKSSSVYHKKLGFYVCWLGTDAVKSTYILDLRKDNGERVGWFKESGINATWAHWDDDRYIYGTVDGWCASERIAGTSLDFSDVGQEYFATGAVNTSTEVITVANSYQTQDAVKVRTSNTVPAGLTANTTYFVIRVSATTIKLATSAANALAGTAINITSQGTGTHSLISLKPISAFYTTNWIKFKNAAEVKKLGKPMILLNAAARSINLTMQTAVDWFESFGDPHTISIISTDTWGLLSWGSFVWGAGAVSAPKNVAIARRKVRSIRFKFSNAALNEDFNLKGLELYFSEMRNRGDTES